MKKWNKSKKRKKLEHTYSTGNGVDGMDTSKVTAEFRAAQWIQIIKDRQESGMNIKNYCLSKGISRDSYFYWQSKLRNSACNSMTKAGEISAPVPKGWMQLSDTGEIKSSLNIEVSGCRIVVDNNTDPELLKNICRILRTM